MFASKLRRRAVVLGLLAVFYFSRGPAFVEPQRSSKSDQAGRAKVPADKVARRPTSDAASLRRPLRTSLKAAAADDSFESRPMQTKTLVDTVFNAGTFFFWVLFLDMLRQVYLPRFIAAEHQVAEGLGGGLMHF
eukprot:TRINITY_DN63797_c0_g1_i1.p1 TRINITY_DN63797_c0_g1~~TRINITY_DN63797_c0_g1_i1.p1  ORF type:complete len:134 (+),score=30.70 TRINITY_DN63797_c0_g1_i1:151-552(+)